MASGKERYMDFKWIGAILIVAGCGGFGFALSDEHTRQEKSLRKLIGLLDYMACELQYRMTPLPELCLQVSREADGPLHQVFERLSELLDNPATSDVADAMMLSLSASGQLPDKTRDNLLLLGRNMGRFDLAGQLESLETVRASCRRELEAFSADRQLRLRNYQTLGLCAGAALAIILI